MTIKGIPRASLLANRRGTVQAGHGDIKPKVFMPDNPNPGKAGRAVIAVGQ
jgi:hypothetical protein